jgi:hypothetical protein
MTKISKILTVGAVAAAIGGGLVLPAVIYAASYDLSTHTIEADGATLDSASLAALIGDSDNSINITGTIDQVRGTRAALSAWKNSNLALSEVTSLLSKIGTLTELNVDIAGDAVVTPNDLGYLNSVNSVFFLTKPTTNITVEGTVSFGDPTGDYAGKTIADMTNSKMTLTAEKIVLPYGADEDTFFGAAKYDAKEIVYASAPAGGGVIALTSPETGQASGSSSAVLVAAASALAAIGGGAVVLRRLNR